MNAKAWLLAGVLAASGCWEDGGSVAEPDLTPPALLGVAALGPRCAEVRFSEPVALVPGSFASDPPLELAGCRSEANAVVLDTELQTPGARYVIELAVEDARGNSAHVLAVLYGFNPEIPDVLINELTVRGSATHPDVVELRVASPGDMGGLVALDGTAGSWTSRIVFPSFRVEAGEFLLLHFKPQGIAVEIDETEDKALSGGLDASPTAYDFWVPDGAGLNGNNGVVSLYARVGGPLLDAILYSNRTSGSDTAYAGFGTAETLARAVEVTASGGWVCEGGAVRPEDAVNPEESTSTRSICRRRGCDTDTRADWYIVVTRGFTFGGENREDEYAP